MNELAEIAERLMPEVPGNLTTPTPKNGTEDQKNKLPATAKQQLNQRQEEHSNQ